MRVEDQAKLCLAAAQTV